MGTTEAMIRWAHRGPVVQQPNQLLGVPTGKDEGPEPSEERLKALLPGSQVLSVQRTSLNIRTTAGVGRAAVLGASAYAAAYIATFGGAFYRQRSLLECMLLILVVLYLPLSPARAMMRIHVWLAAIAAVAVVHSPHLAPATWSKYLAVCVMALAVPLAFMYGLRRGAARRFRERHT